MTAQAPYESLSRMADKLGMAVASADPLTAASVNRIAAELRALAALPERAPVSAAHTWQRRWKGSPPEKGFSIVAEDHLTHPTEIAFLGEVDGDAVDAIINAHNASLAAPAPPVGADWDRPGGFVLMPVMLDSRIEDAFDEVADAAGGGPMLCAAYDAMIDEARRLYGAAAPTPAEARGVGDGVRALVAKWRGEALENGCMGDPCQCDDCMTLARCADELEAALAANKPAGEDRRVLTEALADLDVSAWECPKCGHSEDCATMDVAHMIRAHLDDTRQAQAQGSEAAHAQAGEGSSNGNT